MEYERKMRHEVIIKASDNGGWIVTVGCCHLTFDSVTKMVTAIRDICTNPREEEKKHGRSMEDVSQMEMPQTVAGSGSSLRGGLR